MVIGFNLARMNKKNNSELLSNPCFSSQHVSIINFNSSSIHNHKRYIYIYMFEKKNDELIECHKINEFIKKPTISIVIMGILYGK